MLSNSATPLRKAAAEDLRLLAFLHSVELDSESLAELRSHPLEENFGLHPNDPDSLAALEMMEKGWREMDPDESKLLEDLAADFAAIYLTYRLRASPSESPWLDEDNLQRQEPMFEIRRLYQKHGYQATDWRERPDDHLVLQLQFAAFLLDDQSHQAEVIRSFLSEHLMQWLDPFCTRVAERCATPFYRGLALLTLARVNAIMSLITGMAEETSSGNASEAGT